MCSLRLPSVVSTRSLFIILDALHLPGSTVHWLSVLETYVQVSVGVRGTMDGCSRELLTTSSGSCTSVPGSAVHCVHLLGTCVEVLGKYNGKFGSLSPTAREYNRPIKSRHVTVHRVRSTPIDPLSAIPCLWPHEHHLHTIYLFPHKSELNSHWATLHSCTRQHSNRPWVCHARRQTREGTIAPNRTAVGGSCDGKGCGIVTNS